MFGNSLAGVTGREGAEPVVRRNRIHDGKSVGIHVHDNGRALLRTMISAETRVVAEYRGWVHRKARPQSGGSRFVIGRPAMSLVNWMLVP